MKKLILKNLSCLSCQSPLHLISFDKNSSEDVKNGKLYCTNCCEIYPIYKGIPIIIRNNKINQYLSKPIKIFSKKWNFHFENRTDKKNNQTTIASAKRWSFLWHKFGKSYLSNH